ncbi:MAG: response regulator transcription factor [Solirubrobacteraceae bacterium]
MGPTVLVVEDEQSIGAIVRTYLQREGFRVLWVRTGEEALAELARHPISLMVLDVGLPGVSGLEVCRHVRGRVPIIMLTARDEEADRVAGLELGADDYVAKPFSPRELVARVRAVLRRTGGRAGAGGNVLTLGPVTLSRERREVCVEGQEIALTPKEFELLGYLMERAGTVVSRDSLLEEVWGFLARGETRTVEVHVGQVRKKLGDPSLIRTVRGVGYKAVAR